jgi:hypothetical protein
MYDTRNYRFGHPLELLNVDSDEVILAFKSKEGFAKSLPRSILLMARMEACDKRPASC